MKPDYSNNKSGIYKITTLHNGEFYVGSASNFQKRWGVHMTDFIKNKHHSPYLQNVFNKYGRDNLSFKVLEETLKERKVLLEREQYYIDNLKPVYNTSKTAGSNLGMKMSDSAKENMRKAQTGRKHSPETLSKLKIAKSPENISLETRAKLVVSNKGENNPHTSLKDVDVMEIQKLIMQGKLSHSQIGKLFGVGRSGIGLIANGKTWTHIKADGFEPIVQVNQKLTVEQVIEIKTLLRDTDKTNAAIAKMFNMSGQHISSIKNNIKWKSVIIDSVEKPHANLQQT